MSETIRRRRVRRVAIAVLIVASLVLTALYVDALVFAAERERLLGAWERYTAQRSKSQDNFVSLNRRMKYFADYHSNPWYYRSGGDPHLGDNLAENTSAFGELAVEYVALHDDFESTHIFFWHTDLLAMQNAANKVADARARESKLARELAGRFAAAETGGVTDFPGLYAYRYDKYVQLRDVGPDIEARENVFMRKAEHSTNGMVYHVFNPGAAESTRMVRELEKEYE